MKIDGIENPISQVLEKFGSYQRWQYLYACLPAVFITMININYVFVVGDLNYRCVIPECENSYEMTPAWWPNMTVDRCSKPVLSEYAVQGSCNPDSFTNTVEMCSEWIYENNNTVVAELDLGCQYWKINLIGTIHNIGMLFSMLVSGWLADRFGRKPTLILCAFGSSIGQLKAFATSYYMYATIEFLEASLSGGTYAAAMVLMIEIGGKKNRILAGMLFAYAIYLGESLFALTAMGVPYWKNLVRIIYTPPIFIIFLFFFIKESPRWQILNGKSEEAKKTIKYAAKKNGIDLTNMDLNENEMRTSFNIGKMENKEGYGTIFKSKQTLKRLAVASFCRFTATFVYYGLMINSVWLPGDKYTNFLLATIMSFPGELVALYLLNKFGRKKPLILGFMFNGLLCVASGYVPQAYTITKISLFLLGKMVIALCFTGAVTYTMELFPTSARGSLLGICALFSRAGGMLAPLTPILATYSPALPSMCFGSAAVISGLLLTITPETKDTQLVDTIDQINTAARLKKQIRKEAKLGLGEDGKLSEKNNMADTNV